MIKDNTVVSIHYTLTNQQGEVLDSSVEAEPLQYLAGAGHIIIGLEKALVGKVVGDTLDITIPAAEAYGEVNPEMIQQVPRSSFDGVEDIQPGMQFEASSENGSLVVTVTEVTDETVVVDANHPLAGQDLTFDVSVEAVRDASEDEISQGQIL